MFTLPPAFTLAVGGDIVTVCESWVIVSVAEFVPE